MVSLHMLITGVVTEVIPAELVSLNYERKPMCPAELVS